MPPRSARGGNDLSGNHRLPPVSGSNEARGAWVLASYVLARKNASRDAHRLAQALLDRIGVAALDMDNLHHPTLVAAALAEAAGRIEADLERFAAEDAAAATSGPDPGSTAGRDAAPPGPPASSADDPPAPGRPGPSDTSSNGSAPRA